MPTFLIKYQKLMGKGDVVFDGRVAILSNGSNEVKVPAPQHGVEPEIWLKLFHQLLGQAPEYLAVGHIIYDFRWVVPEDKFDNVGWIMTVDHVGLPQLQDGRFVIPGKVVDRGDIKIEQEQEAAQMVVLTAAQKMVDDASAERWVSMQQPAVWQVSYNSSKMVLHPRMSAEDLCKWLDKSWEPLPT